MKRDPFHFIRLNDLFMAVAVHLAIVMFVAVTFPNTSYPVKPHFIFLGSFLSEQDMSFSVNVENPYQRNFDARTINMDVRRDAYSHSVSKPGQGNNPAASEKRQYKPVMAVDFPVQKKEVQFDDLGESYESIPPVRMKLIIDDKN